MNHPIKIPLPLLVDNPWVNVKSIYPDKSWFILTILFTLAIPLISLTKEPFKTSDIEPYLLFSAIILCMMIFVFSLFLLIYVFLLRKCIIINENNLTFFLADSSSKNKKVIAKNSIRKLVIEKRITQFGGQNLNPYDTVGTFTKLIIIDENNFKYVLTPEVYSNDGNYPKTWSNFLTKLSTNIGLPIENEIKSSND